MRWSHRSERSTDDGTQDQGEARVQANPHEQHDRTAQPRDPQTHARGRLVPGRAERVDARLRVRYVTSSEWSTRRYLDISRPSETVPTAN